MTKLLIYGVDGLNPDMVQHMIDQGEMPNFEKLQQRENTVYGEMESFICEGYSTPHTGPMWTSIYTGLKPEEHGLLSGGWNEGDSEFHNMYTVWDKLSDEGHSMILYGMPMTYKGKEINGEMVAGFVHPTLKSTFHKAVYPESLYEKLPENFIEYTSSYIQGVRTKGATPSSDSENFYSEMSHGEAQRIAHFTNIYDEDSAEIVAYGTTYADKIGHVAGIEKGNEYAEKTYSEVDDTLGLLLETLKPEHVMVVSDHGFTEYEHSLTGYGLDTTGEGIGSVFDFTPTLLQHFDLEYEKPVYGKIKEDTNIHQAEKDDIKKKLEKMGYF